MFNNNKSDFAATIGGFFLVGFFALCLAINVLDARFEWTDGMYMGSLFLVASVIGLITGFVCLYKAFLTEGMTFILVSVCALCISGGIIGNPAHGISLSLVFLVAFAIVAFMGFREGYLDLTIINGLFAIFSFIYFGFTFEAAVIFVLAALILLAAAAVSFYVAVVEWMGAQDFIQEYEEAVFGGCCDDNCCCDDDCDCDCDDDECDCHKD